MLGTPEKTHRAYFRNLRHAGALCLPAVAGHGLAEGGRALSPHLRRRYPGHCHQLSCVEVSARHGKMVERERSGQ